MQKIVKDSIGYECYVLNFFSRCRTFFCSLPEALFSSQQFNPFNYNQLYLIPQTLVTSFIIIFFILPSLHFTALISLTSSNFSQIFSPNPSIGGTKVSGFHCNCTAEMSSPKAHVKAWQGLFVDRRRQWVLNTALLCIGRVYLSPFAWF